MTRNAVRPPRSFTPQLQLETLFTLDGEGRILSTREPNPTRGPSFALIRDRRACAWAVHAAVPDYIASELAILARDERPTSVISDRPQHADAYVALVGGRVDSGPVYSFPSHLRADGETVLVTDIAQLLHHFRGWTADEIPERAPIVALLVDGQAVSVCFCARRSPIAAEAGVETAVAYRGRGFAARVTTTWAALIQESGRLPLYSTSWNNRTSLAVARKLALSPCGVDWTVYEGEQRDASVDGNTHLRRPSTR